MSTIYSTEPATTVTAEQPKKFPSWAKRTLAGVGAAFVFLAGIAVGGGGKTVETVVTVEKAPVVCVQAVDRANELLSATSNALTAITTSATPEERKTLNQKVVDKRAQFNAAADQCKSAK